MTTYTQRRWSLADLFPAQESPEMHAAFERAQALNAKFAEHRQELSDNLDPEHFREMVEEYEALTRLVYRIYGFASLSFAADTQDQEVQAFQARVQKFGAEMQNKVLFFTLWWKELPAETADRLLHIAGDYRYWLEQLRAFKPHTLSEPEEKIINIKDVNGVAALNNLYDSMTNRYVFKLKVNGEERELTRGELTTYFRNADPDLRSAAYQELFRVYGQDAPILGQIYSAIVNDWYNEQVELRKFTRPISSRNLHNDIPDEVVDTLLSVSRQNTGIFQRFFRLKARLLGVEQLRRYDLYAPVAQSTKTYSFNTGADMVLDAFERFEPRLETLARRVFDADHLDSEVRKGKRSGAFCSTLGPDLTPWVLVNYQGRADDVATLAHELGHAIHSMLAESHTLFTQDSSLPLAENASTFGEMLLIDHLLSKETDPAVRRDVLFRQVDDAYATIQRQAFFAMFEVQAHEMLRQGATIDQVSEKYLEELRAQFGDSMQVSDDFRYEWVAIPHFTFAPFYVYAYSFGQLLVLSLYQQYREQGEAFKPRYLKILTAGGSASPEQVLSEAGIDMRQASFWQGGFDVLAALVDQLEALA